MHGEITPMFQEREKIWFDFLNNIPFQFLTVKIFEPKIFLNPELESKE